MGGLASSSCFQHFGGAFLFYVAITKTLLLALVNRGGYNSGDYMAQRTEELIQNAATWCRQKRGRQSELARALGINRQAVYEWFKQKRQPTTEQALTLIEFLADPEKFQKEGRARGKT